MQVASETLDIKAIFEQHKDINMEEFKQLFIRSDQFSHLLLSDAQRIVTALQKDFPDIIKVSSIGDSYQERPINVIELDAESFFKKPAGVALA